MIENTQKQSFPKINDQKRSKEIKNNHFLKLPIKNDRKQLKTIISENYRS